MKKDTLYNSKLVLEKMEIVDFLSSMSKNSILIKSDNMEYMKKRNHKDPGFKNRSRIFLFTSSIKMATYFR